MYKATVNGVVFFDTSIEDDRFSMTHALLSLTKGMAGTFDFIIPSCNLNIDYFYRLSSFVDLYRDDDLIYSGRVYSLQSMADNSLSVVCEGLLAVLNDSIFEPIEFDGYLHRLVSDMLDSHNAQVDDIKKVHVGTLYVSDAKCYRAYENYQSTWSRLQDLADSYGGFFAIRKTSNGLYLDWYDHCIDGSSQAINFGENLIDITKYHDADKIVTILTPLGAANDENVRVDISSVNGGSKQLVASSQYRNIYGRVHKSQIWDDVTEPSILMAKGQQYMLACLEPQYTVNVTAVDLANAGYNIDHFAVGQRLKVTAIPNGINGEWFDVNSLTIDIFSPESNRLSLGTELSGYVKRSKSSFTTLSQGLEKIAALYTPRSALTDAINQATSLITGNSGGYIILHDSNNDGEPDELLVMDTPDINTAVKIWRFNNAGLGYSSTGYSGEYGLAMTMDGAIVADRITTGALNGTLIKTGKIQSEAHPETYWDLDQGILHIQGSGDTDKSKVFIYEPVPPYFVGDLWITSSSETSGVVGYAVAGNAIVGDDSGGEGGKILACIYTRTSGEFHQSDWSAITEYASETDLEILRYRLTNAELNIAANAAQIELKADETVIDGYGQRISSAESSIAINSNNIALKVSESDITGDYVVSKINLSSTTAKIQARNIDLQGAVTISTFSNDAKSELVTGTTSRNQYYLSTSDTALSGGSWSNSVRWASGRYIWTRIATTKTYADNSTDTSYSDAFYDYNLTTAMSVSADAQTKANGAVGAAVSIYYRSTTNSLPSISTSTSIGTSDSTDNAWTYVLPRPKRNAYFFTCERYVNKENAVSFSTVRPMSNLTVSSLWCSANGATYIDGAAIYTNSITATQIASSAITAEKIATGAITVGKIDNALTNSMVTNTTVKNQYYLSSSDASLTGGAWRDSIPASVAWTSGKYVWMRVATTKNFITGDSSTTYSDAVYDRNITNALSSAATANSTANTASATASGAVASTVSAYYRSTSNSTPSISASTSIGTSDSTDNVWTYILPKPKRNVYFFTCEVYTYKNGNKGFSAVRPMSNLTASSLWCSANNATEIDGAFIATGTILANSIAANSITADQLHADSVGTSELQADSINAGHIKSGAITADKISAGAITSTKITADGITADKIKGGTIQSSDIKLGGSSYGELNLYNSSNKLEARLFYSGLYMYNSGTRTGKIGNNIYTGNTVYMCFDLASGASGFEISNASNETVLYRFNKSISKGFEIYGTDYVEAIVSSREIYGQSLSIYGSKNRIVETKNYGKKLLYCTESPTPLFEDIGTSKTDEYGEAYIMIDDVFSETIANVEYSVFLQKEGDGDIWVDEKETNYFVVKGTPNLKFSWILKTAQCDYEQTRLETYNREMNESAEDYILEQEDLLYETA